MFWYLYLSLVFFFFFKQKTAYEMRISDWSSDVCSSDLHDAILMWVRKDKVQHVWDRGLEIMSHPELLDDFEINLSVTIEADAKVGPWGAGKIGRASCRERVCQYV